MRSVILALEGADAGRALPIVRAIARRHAAGVVIVDAGEPRGDIAVLVRALQDEGFAVELETHPEAPGRAAEIVAEVARRRDGGLIVVAAGRPPQNEEAPSAGLTQRLLRAAPCPVVAVPSAA